MATVNKDSDTRDRQARAAELQIVVQRTFQKFQRYEEAWQATAVRGEIVVQGRQEAGGRAPAPKRLPPHPPRQ